MDVSQNRLYGRYGRDSKSEIRQPGNVRAGLDHELIPESRTYLSIGCK